MTLKLNLDPYSDDKLREECGIFGMSNNSEAASHTILGLHALQHRGQEAAGIVSYDGKTFHARHKLGLVGDNFSSEHTTHQLQGSAAVGHVRYSTSGGNEIRNIQPIFAELSFGGLAIAHNGNLTNAQQLRSKLIQQGCIFQSTMDTEVIIHLIATSKQALFIDRLQDAIEQIEGAFALILLNKDYLVGLRDKLGIRPLVIGKLNNSYIFASETCALDIIGAEYIRDVKPGEIVIIKDDEVTSIEPEIIQKKFCVFEYIYFARPDSRLEGKNVYQIRKNIGSELAKEVNIDADIVVPVPDSGVPAAMGFSNFSNLPFELGIIRNHYVGRTFIEPTDQVRHLGVKLKHNANRDIIYGKRIILVDDSIVRGTTSQKIVMMLREAGAKEIHMCIASPAITHPCFYGVDTPKQNKLLAANYNIEEMTKFIGVDSLTFVSVAGLYCAVTNNRIEESGTYCDACFTGNYPVPVVDSNQIQLT